jgi:predicted esterase
VSALALAGRQKEATERFEALCDRIGALADRPASAYVYIGTTGWVAATMTLADVDPPRDIYTLADPIHGDRAILISPFLNAGSALEWLAAQPRIAPARIALMGFSRGGQAVLYASLKRLQRLHVPADVRFAAYLPFYPACNTAYAEDTEVADAQFPPSQPTRYRDGLLPE